MNENEKAIQALRYLYQFAELEAKVAAGQANQATEVRDYRAADRHIFYSHAMRKVRSKCVAYARENFLADIRDDADKPEVKPC